jgi:hypothetical protein
VLIRQLLQLRRDLVPITRITCSAALQIDDPDRIDDHFLNAADAVVVEPLGAVTAVGAGGSDFPSAGCTLLLRKQLFYLAIRLVTSRDVESPQLRRSRTSLDPKADPLGEEFPCKIPPSSERRIDSNDHASAMTQDHPNRVPLLRVSDGQLIRPDERVRQNLIVRHARRIPRRDCAKVASCAV